MAFALDGVRNWGAFGERRPASDDAGVSRLPDASLAAPALVLSANDSLTGTVPHLGRRQRAQRRAPCCAATFHPGRKRRPVITLVGSVAAETALLSRRGEFSSEQGSRHVLGVGCGLAVLNTDDPLHAQQRRTWSPAFAGRDTALV